MKMTMVNSGLKGLTILLCDRACESLSLKLQDQLCKAQSCLYSMKMTMVNSGLKGLTILLCDRACESFFIFIISPPINMTSTTLSQYWVTVSCLAPSCMWASVTVGCPTLTLLWFKTSCWYSLYYASLPLTQQCFGVMYISLMPGHCVRCWPTFKRHWGRVYTMCTYSRLH